MFFYILVESGEDEMDAKYDVGAAVFMLSSYALTHLSAYRDLMPSPQAKLGRPWAVTYGS